MVHEGLKSRWLPVMLALSRKYLHLVMPISTYNARQQVNDTGVIYERHTELIAGHKLNMVQLSNSSPFINGRFVTVTTPTPPQKTFTWCSGRGDTINQSSKAPPLERRAHLIHHNAFTANPQPHISELLYGATEVFLFSRSAPLAPLKPSLMARGISNRYFPDFRSRKIILTRTILSHEVVEAYCGIIPTSRHNSFSSLSNHRTRLIHFMYWNGLETIKTRTERKRRHSALSLCLPVIHYLVVNIIISERLLYLELIITVSLCSSSRVSRVCQELIITVSLCSSSRVSRVCQVIHYLVVNIIISERLLYLVCRDLRHVNLRLLSLQELIITVSLCSSSRVSRVCQVIHYLVVNIIISERLLYLVCRDLRHVNLRLLSLQELIITVSLCSSSRVENVQTGFHS
ncbi:hypothetical protein J6590_038904 [Homalodisca vitripennis]|nr:hypothetical protein J6590_038904 [Homalodisca vitripennis]